MSIICAFGDSITWGAFDTEKGGWVERLKTYLLESDNDVYNLGISGDKTPHVLERFEIETKARAEEGEYVILIFAIGINDSYFIQSKNDFMTSPDNFKQNIKEIIERAQKISSKIIFVGLTPVDESKTKPIPWDTDKFFKNENIEKYNKIVRSACKEKNVHFIEIFDNWIKSGYQDMLEDGLHPNSEGHKKIFEAVKNFLVQNKAI